MKIVICLLIILLVSLGSVSAYPVMTFEKEVNITEAKEAVYSIPEKYFEYVTKIDLSISQLKNGVRGNEDGK